MTPKVPGRKPAPGALPSPQPVSGRACAIDRCAATSQVKQQFESNGSKHPFDAIILTQYRGNSIVAKTDLGTKRVCPDTGRKFYDLGKTPVISPYTGKVVPIVLPPQSRSRPESAAARPAPVDEVETVTPETEDAEFVSLEDAENEQQGKGKKKGKPADDDIDADDDESLDDAAFIEEQEDGDPDVTDIIGDGIEKDEEQ
jgi:uncharacterized protein (TIGR02300 family)